MRLKGAALRSAGVLAFVQVTLQATVLQVQLHEQRISEQNDTAYVREIMRLAKSAEMRNYMLPEVDACDNFFNYACGNWAEINPVDDITSRETNFFALMTNAYKKKQLKILQQSEPEEATEAETLQKVKHFYQACLHLGELRRDTYKMKLWQVMDEFGQMPVVLPDGAWEADDFDWLAVIAQIQHKYGLDIILQMGIRQDFDNKTVSKLFIGQPALRLQTKSMYTHEAAKWHRESYKQEIQTNLETFLGVDSMKAKRTAEEIFIVEAKLAKGVMDRRLGKTLRSMTKLHEIEELQAAYAPTIDFKKFITIALGHELNTTVYEYYADYQVNLVNVIRETNKAHLANYIMYQLLQVFFYNTEEPLVVREKTCLGKTKAFFAKILDNVIFRHYNSKETGSGVNLIWQRIKDTFKSQLQSEKLQWLTPVTRELALEKLTAMQLHINAYEDADFDGEYAALDVSSKDYVENIKQLLQFETKRALANLYKPPATIEAALMLSYSPAYIATENLIKIPVSLLQPNFLWSDNYPQALRFGTLGYLVAHELIHGFDDMGRNFDALGHEKGWWDANSTHAFNERKSCFKRQYARYRYGGKYLPESELQSENIADNGAIQVAYAAYESWLANATAAHTLDLELELLPNMDFTKEQLFFISFAQYWCNDVNEHFKDKVSLVNLHAPAMYRVIGSLANFDVFSQHFHCAKGTTMNPEKKCQIY